ncbi:MAG: permease prefix domain 1-containing protein, partial [Terriglobia bacterium]
MRRFRSLLLRFGSPFRRSSSDRQFGEELESHLALHVDDNLRSGMEAAEARRQAVLKLG